MDANEYSYDYDPIGNRDQYTIDNGQLITTNVYAANGLNQYTNILNCQLSTLNSFDLDGQQKSVKLKPRAKSDRDFEAVRMHGARSLQQHRSGNCYMLTNATHAFTWDAENRLLTASNLTTAAVCNFIYDHQSRSQMPTESNSKRFM